jgi:hypothetical protein
METKQSEKIEFDLSKALVVIEKDKDLNDMFREEYGTDYKVCHALINSGVGMKHKAEKYIRALFDGVILEKKELRNLYLSLKDNNPSSETNPNKKRWGLRAIEKDVKENFNGKGKQIHSTGKQVQELKKEYARLEMRMYNERFVDEKLTDKELREISGAIETFSKKIKSILKPKK